MGLTKTTQLSVLDPGQDPGLQALRALHCPGLPSPEQNTDRALGSTDSLFSVWGLHFSPDTNSWEGIREVEKVRDKQSWPLSAVESLPEAKDTAADQEQGSA